MAFIDNEIANAVRGIYIIISRMFPNEATVMSHEMISIRDSKDWSSDSMTIARKSRVKYVTYDIVRTIR